jgi:DNA-binding transcriptional MocR family regulator
MSDPIPWPAERLVAQLGWWSAKRGALYRLLADALVELIDSGRLPARAALPPDRVLADRLAVGRTTVVAAYDLLRESGRLERHQGKGTWVAAAGADERSGGAASTTNPLFLAYLSSPDRVLPLACTASHGPPPVLAEAYAAALAMLPVASRGTGYHPLGHRALREAVAGRYETVGIATTPDQILVSNGGQQALALLARFLVSPGDRVLVPVPCYPGALEVFREAGADLVTVPASSAGLDVEAWIQAVNTTKPRAAYLNLTHHNPTGTTVPGLVRRRLAEVAAARGVALIDDTVLDELGFAGPMPVQGWAEGSGARIFTVGSLSKTVWGGLRVGWIRGGQTDIAVLAGLKAVSDLGGPVLEQLAASLLVPDLATIARQRGAELRQHHDHLRAELAAQLPEWEVSPVAGGQCLWVRLPETDATQFAQVAMRHGVVVLPGVSFAPDGQYGDRLRIPFTAPTNDLTDAVRALAAAWSSYRHGGAEAAYSPDQPLGELAPAAFTLS